MSKWSRSPGAIARDIVIARWHPEYQDRGVLDALRELKEARRGA